MKRVAVFGNAGGGKSTLARRLAEMTGLPLYVIDMMQFKPGGAKVPDDEFLQVHADLLCRDEWIIDGFGSGGDRLGPVRRRGSIYRYSSTTYRLRSA